MHDERYHRLCPFFFTHTATTEIYTLSLHDALPISLSMQEGAWGASQRCARRRKDGVGACPPLWRSGPYAVFPSDRKSTRLNSSHSQISYAVFCLKKKS